MKVFCTGYFLELISDLEKKNNYSGIFKDICAYFSDKNIGELHITKDILRNSPGINSINKYRIPNSTIGIGKRGSYRCIAMCNVKSDKVFVDFIYPKTGSEGSENITKDGIKGIAVNITNSIQSGNIYEIDLKNEEVVDLKGNRVR